MLACVEWEKLWNVEDKRSIPFVLDVVPLRTPHMYGIGWVKMPQVFGSALWET
jgi:hypothetical protein